MSNIANCYVAIRTHISFHFPPLCSNRTSKLCHESDYSNEPLVMYSNVNTDRHPPRQTTTQPLPRLEIWKFASGSEWKRGTKDPNPRRSGVKSPAVRLYARTLPERRSLNEILQNLGPSVIPRANKQAAYSRNSMCQLVWANTVAGRSISVPAPFFLPRVYFRVINEKITTPNANVKYLFRNLYPRGLCLGPGKDKVRWKMGWFQFQLKTRARD